jgi:hypothetical protein
MLKRLFSLLLAIMLLAQPTARAAQNAVQIPTGSPLPGLTMVQDANGAFSSLATLFSGASAPTAAGLGLTSTAGIMWHDTGNNLLKLRNQADTAWITLGSINETTGVFTPVSGWTESSVSANQTVSAASSGTNLVATAALTLTVNQGTTLGQTFTLRVDAVGGNVTVTPYASDKINGGTAGAALVVPKGYVGEIVTDANGNLYVMVLPGALGVATMASASTVDLGTASASTVNITGTTTISSFGSTAQAGQIYTLVFGGAAQLTYNATSLILPTSTSLTTAAGDVVQALALGSGNWRVIDYQTASGQALAGAGTPPFRNLLIGGDASTNPWQRGTSVSPFISGTSSYTADRWVAWGANVTSSLTVSQASSGLTGFPYAFRVQRTAANADTGVLGLAQVVESVNVKAYQGKTLTLSFQARAGANFSASGNALSVNIATGTGTDEGSAAFVAGTWTGYVANTSTKTLTTSWQTFTVSITVPTGANELAVSFSYTPSGTAGANDNFDLAEVELDAYGASSFEVLPKDIVLARSARYFWSGAARSMGYVTSGGLVGVFDAFPVVMRATPSITIGTVSVGGSGFPSSGWSVYQSDAHALLLGGTATSTASGQVTINYTANGEL